MPILRLQNAELFYDVRGDGETVLAVHGLIENSEYWIRSGVADLVAQRCRFVACDMRGHGRSQVTGTPEGFDVETLASDIDAIADALGVERFHLIGHATGGMVASRYASRNTGRLRSLVLAGTSSATGIVEPHKVQSMAAGFRGKDWDTLLGEMRASPGPFLHRLDYAGNAEELWHTVREIFELGDPDLLATFISQFYDDPNPHTAALRAITCPVLVIAGEHDALMRPFSERLAQEIPGAELRILPGVGHMTALETPHAFGETLTRFLGSAGADADP